MPVGNQYRRKRSRVGSRTLYGRVSQPQTPPPAPRIPEPLLDDIKYGTPFLTILEQAKGLIVFIEVNFAFYTHGKNVMYCDELQKELTYFRKMIRAARKSREERTLWSVIIDAQRVVLVAEPFLDE